MPVEKVIIQESGIKIVTVGIQGPPGPQGIQGIQGLAGDSNYIHNQGAPSAIWTIIHNLGKFPSVTTVDSGGTKVWGNVAYIDQNTVEVQFSVPFGGKAYLN